jgi:hypothetical protein
MPNQSSLRNVESLRFCHCRKEVPPGKSWFLADHLNETTLALLRSSVVEPAWPSVGRLTIRIGSDIGGLSSPDSVDKPK